MAGSSGWMADESYEKWEREARAKKPSDRTEAEVNYLASLDKMRQAEVAGRHWTFYWIFRPLLIYIVCTPFMMFGYVVYVLLTKTL